MKISEHRIVGILALALMALCMTGIAKAQQAWDTNQLQWGAPLTCTSGQPIANCPVTGYRVERAASQTGTFAALGTSATTSYTHTSAAAGVNCYRVIALSASGNSAPSNVACKTNVQPSGPPTPPTNLTVVETTAFNVKPNLQRFAFERGTRAGTIRLGAACDESRVTSDGYTVISRPSQVIPRPQTGVVLVAKCG
jgi:hypothetical protein